MAISVWRVPATVKATTSNTFGFIGIGETPEEGSPPSNYEISCIYTMPESGHIIEMSWYLSDTDGSSCVAALYDVNTGDSLCNSTTPPQEISTAQWYNFSFSYDGVGGTAYRLTLLRNGGITTYYDTGTSGQAHYGYSYSGYPTFDSSWSGAGGALDWKISCYCTYTQLAGVSAVLDEPSDLATVTDYPVNFNYTPTVVGDNFYDAELIINDTVVAHNATAITNNALNTISYTFPDQHSLSELAKC